MHLSDGLLRPRKALYCCVPRDDSELPILLPPPSQCLGNRLAPPCLTSAELGMKSKPLVFFFFFFSLCFLGEHSTRSQPPTYFQNFSPATGIAPGSRRLASWTLPLAIWYFIEGRPQTEQVEGFITLVTQDQLVILTCRQTHTALLAAQQNKRRGAALLSSLLKVYFYLCP